MREVKFRAIPAGKDYFVYGYYAKLGKGENADHYIIQNGSEVSIFEKEEDSKYFNDVLIDLKTLGQATGLKDKNGKEIYEGDIVSCSINRKEYVEIDDSGNKIYSNSKGKAIWSIEYKERFSQGNGFYFFGKDRRFNIRATQGTITNCEIEIIGNIYGNPELMESVKA